MTNEQFAQQTQDLALIALEATFDECQKRGYEFQKTDMGGLISALILISCLPTKVKGNISNGVFLESIRMTCDSVEADYPND